MWSSRRMMTDSRSRLTGVKANHFILTVGVRGQRRRGEPRRVGLLPVTLHLVEVQSGTHRPGDPAPRDPAARTGAPVGDTPVVEVVAVVARSLHALRVRVLRSMLT